MEAAPVPAPPWDPPWNILRRRRVSILLCANGVPAGGRDSRKAKLLAWISSTGGRHRSSSQLRRSFFASAGVPAEAGQVMSSGVPDRRFRRTQHLQFHPGRRAAAHQLPQLLLCRRLFAGRCPLLPPYLAPCGIALWDALWKAVCRCTGGLPGYGRSVLVPGLVPCRGAPLPELVHQGAVAVPAGNCVDCRGLSRLLRVEHDLTNSVCSEGPLPVAPIISPSVLWALSAPGVGQPERRRSLLHDDFVPSSRQQSHR